ncbi:hypothetical protein OPT61_g4 [Boeremia exigua]|uniref:Uncharacterized protein n=1 Tax=Boeremia exigua TaxID=749465 RepID=A0ACC2IV82_9PLEO|nr:hypothetical protein OPT61_g4 [Boeremia exigua]
MPSQWLRGGQVQNHRLQSLEMNTGKMDQAMNPFLPRFHAYAAITKHSIEPPPATEKKYNKKDLFISSSAPNMVSGRHAYSMASANHVDARDIRRETRPHKEKVIAQQKLTLQQEEELVTYIEELTAQHIPPTREIIQNFALSVAKERVSESWVTRFINNYSIDLISQYSTGMDANRHNADSYAKSSSSTYSGEDWLKIETLLRRVAKDKSSKELRKKKHKNKSKALDFQEPEEYHSGAVFYSPYRVDKARQYKQVKQQEVEAEEARKAEMAELRRANKLYKERVAQERREQQAREKEERDQVKAKKAEEVAERKAERER